MTVTTWMTKTCLKTMFALFALLGAGAPVAAAPFHHPAGEWREYNRDWLAACPDEIVEDDVTSYYGTSCFASTGSQDLNSAGLPAWKLTLIHNRLSGDIDLAFTAAPTSDTLDTSRPLRFEFTGSPAIELAFATDLETRFSTTNQWFIADDARRDSLIELLQSRTSLTLAIPVTDPETPVRHVRLSLQGVLASLDFMANYARRVSQY